MWGSDWCYWIMDWFRIGIALLLLALLLSFQLISFSFPLVVTSVFPSDCPFCIQLVFQFDFKFQCHFNFNAISISCIVSLEYGCF